MYFNGNNASNLVRNAKKRRIFGKFGLKKNKNKKKRSFVRFDPVAG